jgi:chromosome segregation ATPase
MLAEAGRAAAIRCASEAAREAEIRVYDEVKRSQGLGDEKVRAENARLEEELRRVNERLMASEMRADGLVSELESSFSQARGLHDSERMGLEMEHRQLMAENSRLRDVETRLLQQAERDVGRRSSEVRLRSDGEALKVQFSTLEGERDELYNDVLQLRKAMSLKEETISSLRQSIAQEVSAARLMDEELQQTRSMQAASSDLEAVRQQLVMTEQKNSLLESDMGHMRNASMRKEETISSLRQSLEEVQDAKRLQEDEILQLQQKLADSEAARRYGDFQVASISSEQVKALELQNDQLKQDVRHLRGALSSREQSEVSLREGLDADRRSMLLLAQEVDSLKARSETVQSDVIEYTVSANGFEAPSFHAGSQSQESGTLVVDLSGDMDDDIYGPDLSEVLDETTLEWDLTDAGYDAGLPQPRRSATTRLTSDDWPL